MLNYLRNNVNLTFQADRLIDLQISGAYLELGPGGNPVDIPGAEKHVLDLPEYDLNDIINVHRLPFPRHRFDLVIMREVIEHLLYPREVLNEINTVLKPGGMLLLTTPNYQSIANRLTHLLGKDRLFWRSSDEGIVTYDYDHNGHHYYFSPSSMRHILETTNFGEVHISGYGFGLPVLRFASPLLSRIFPRLSDHMFVTAVKQKDSDIAYMYCDYKKRLQYLQEEECTQPVIGGNTCLGCPHYSMRFLNPDDPRRRRQ